MITEVNSEYSGKRRPLHARVNYSYPNHVSWENHIMILFEESSFKVWPPLFFRCVNGSHGWFHFRFARIVSTPNFLHAFYWSLLKSSQNSEHSDYWTPNFENPQAHALGSYLNHVYRVNHVVIIQYEEKTSLNAGDSPANSNVSGQFERPFCTCTGSCQIRSFSGVHFNLYVLLPVLISDGLLLLFSQYVSQLN